ncbi:MAG: hypothetical protein JRG79_08490, partial [Deltaproteobacteria bacterium]|nr:hypothetical protein [Deltaproteobacteria bacterium]
MGFEKEPRKERPLNKHASAHCRIAIGQLSILLLLVAGVLFTLSLQFSRYDEVFFTGDGGVKTLMVRQFATGMWQADLQLRADPWIRELWGRGLYPFGPHFVYEIEGRHYIQYPLLFPVLTAPFYKWFGFRGLTVLPLAGVWAVWAVFLLLCRRRRIESVSTAFGLAGLIFASALTLYSAMFSEHTLAVALSFAGLTLALPQMGRGTTQRDLLIAGLLLGFSVWLRPESGIFVMGAMAALWWIGVRLRHLVSLGIAASVPMALYIATNQWLFGRPLGLHGMQALEAN